MSEKSLRDELIDRFSHDTKEQSKLERVVVVSIDQSSAEYVLEWALTNFIQPSRDLVVLVNARKPSSSIGFVHPSRIVEEFDSQNKEARQASVNLLRDNVDRLRQKNVACQAIALVGEPKDEIIRKVKEIRADVLLMGSRNLGSVQRAFLGSVSDHCVHNCPCAIVVARPSEDEVDKGSKRRSIFSMS